MQVKTKVGPFLSDLFFNHDVSHCVERDVKGNFVRYDDQLMIEEAAMLLDMLRGFVSEIGLGVPHGLIDVTPEDLYEDFKKRI